MEISIIQLEKGLSKIWKRKKKSSTIEKKSINKVIKFQIFGALKKNDEETVTEETFHHQQGITLLYTNLIVLRIYVK